MKLNHLVQSIKIIVLALIIGLGLNYVSAWTGPSAAPPAGNIDAPANVGSVSQYKSGAFGVGGLLAAYAGLTVSGGNIDVSTNKVVNLATPTATTDAATKAYVDAAGGGCVPQMQVFTTSGTWTKPASTSFVYVTMVGAGAGGAGGYYSAGAGGGSGMGIIRYPVTVAADVAVTIGAGGAGGPANTCNAGVYGGSTSFGALTALGGGPGAGCNGYGGQGGVGNTGMLNGTGGGPSAAAPNGAYSLYYGASKGSGWICYAGGGQSGYPGGTCSTFPNGTGSGGNGGGSIFAAGGKGGLGSVGSPGGVGAGGGGGSSDGEYGYNGGAGGSGQVVVEWCQ